MGQAFDDEGGVLGDATGATKREVFDKLMEAHPEAAEIRIGRLKGPPETVAMAELPAYRCHKEVHALKIAEVQVGSGTVAFTDRFFAPKMVGFDWVEKHAPVAGGNYVVYEDGYESFSPAKAFEAGYTLIGADLTLGERAKIAGEGPCLRCVGKAVVGPEESLEPPTTTPSE